MSLAARRPYRQRYEEVWCVVMIDEDEAAELTAANDALKRSLASLTNADDLWPFVIGALTESARAIAAPSAAIFLFDEQSSRMRTAIVLEDGRPVDF
jgi:hypothetical protein